MVPNESSEVAHINLALVVQNLAFNKWLNGETSRTYSWHGNKFCFYICWAKQHILASQVFFKPSQVFLTRKGFIFICSGSQSRKLENCLKKDLKVSRQYTANNELRIKIQKVLDYLNDCANRW